MKSKFASIAVSCREGAVRQAGHGSVGPIDFHTVRNQVVRACARYGTVGPVGEVTLATADSDDPDGGHVVEKPDFYVVDDCYGDEQRIYVEPTANAVSPEWFLELARRLRDHADWDALVSLGEGVTASVSGEAIEIAGWACRGPDLGTILEEIRRHVSARRAEKEAIKSQRLLTVRQLVPSAWAATGALVLVAHFPTASDGSAGDTIWLLHRDDESVFDLDKYKFEPDAVRPSIHWVSRSGELLEEGRPAENGSVALLAEWALRSEGKPVRGASRIRVRKGAYTWDFDLRAH